MPLVSLIITTRNRPHLVARAVESARAAGSDVEIVVVDDASAAETAEVCRTLRGVRYVRAERRQGPAGARNIGLLYSSGEFVSFLDDDDLRLPGSLDSQAGALDAAPDAGLIYGQALIADSSGVTPGDVYPKSCPRGDVFWRLVARNFIPCGSAVFRRSCIMRAGLLDTSLRGVEDWDLWVRISALYPVIALEEPVMVWRRSSPDSEQLSSHAIEMVRQSRRAFRRKWMRLPRAARATGEERRAAGRSFSKNMASHLAVESARALARGRLLSAQANALAALGLHPLGLARAAAGKLFAGRAEGAAV